MATPGDIAQWMIKEVTEKGFLSQRDAARHIEAAFGPSFVYTNRNGNPAIHPEILDIFNGLTRKTVVWNVGTFCWRLRKATDRPGKRTVGLRGFKLDM